ncbi:MAG: hypothetical protein FWF04_03925, partial [Clostridiales bacterium]|nr:hypothetical protein [Clostridiales bacterium]
MKREQLSNRIGNIEDRLIEQAENAPNFRRMRQNRNLMRMASIAAVLVLMVGSFTIGAIAMAKETIVYVEKEQEIIVVGDSGISLILPDTWKDKYGYELDGNNVIVYHTATRETSEYGGDLFRIFCVEGLYPMDYAYPEPGFTIAITKNNTYRISYPSDVQFDTSNPELWADYDELYADVRNVEIVMTAQMLADTMNVTNWVQGTVFVQFLEKWVLQKTVVCDAEQSRIIREIIESQDYNLEPASYFADLW